MRRLVWIIGAIALLWSIYWAVATLLIKEGVSDWLVERRAEGWDVQVSRLGVGGFPIWFDTRVDTTRLADPTGGFQVIGTAVSLRIPAWWPGYPTLSLPEDRVSFVVGDVTLELQARDAEARLRICPGAALELESAQVGSGAWDLKAPAGQLLAGSAVLASFVQDGETPERYAFQVDLDGLTLAGQARAQLAIPQDWPRQLSAATLAGNLRFAAPLNRATLDSVAPQPRRIEIAETQVIWGPVEASAEGALDIDSLGIPTGDIRIMVSNLQRLLTITKAHNTAFAIQTDLLLNGLANLDGDPETLDVTLRFEDGQLSLGGIALGPAPRIAFD